MLPAQHLPCALLTGDGLAEGGTRPGRGSALPASLFGACVLQVAEMHGELIEFNERLHRALVAKEALVSQMRQELIDLRGPVSVVPHAPTRPTPSVCLPPHPPAAAPPPTSAAHSTALLFVPCPGYRKVQRLNEAVSG